MKSRKNKILNNLKSIEHFDWDITESPDQNVSVLKSSDNLFDNFKEKLKQVKGEIYTYKNKDELYITITSILKENSIKQVFCKIPDVESILNGKVELTTLPNEELSITRCEFLISSSGSILVSSDTGPGRSAYIVPKINVIVASSKQLRKEAKEVYDEIEAKNQRYPSWMSLITGPSRTADIEKTLVLGAHGPQKLIVCIDIE